MTTYHLDGGSCLEASATDKGASLVGASCAFNENLIMLKAGFVKSEVRVSLLCLSTKPQCIQSLGNAAACRWFVISEFNKMI